jgi:hypothetical protein
MAEPKRTKERRLRLLPRLMKSSTDSELPRRAIPYADKDDPHRRRLRTLKALPRTTKSRTLRLDPSCMHP